MQQKITFANNPSYYDSKNVQKASKQKQTMFITFGNPANTVVTDIRSNQDQNFNKVQSNFNFNSTTSFVNDQSSVDKYLPNKINLNVSNLKQGVNKIQELYKKQPISQPTLPYQVFPKALQQTKIIKENKIEVTSFKIDTNQIQTIKQNQFVGCFNCFSQVKYNTLKKY